MRAAAETKDDMSRTIDFQLTCLLTESNDSDVCCWRANIQTADDFLDEVNDQEPIVLLSIDIVVTNTARLVNYKGNVKNTSFTCQTNLAAWNFIGNVSYA